MTFYNKCGHWPLTGSVSRQWAKAALSLATLPGGQAASWLGELGARPGLLGRSGNSPAGRPLCGGRDRVGGDVGKTGISSQSVTAGWWLTGRLSHRDSEIEVATVTHR